MITRSDKNMDILNSLALCEIAENKYIARDLEIIFDDLEEAIQYAKEKHFSGIAIL